MLITCCEEFITTFPGRGSSRSKLPQLELIQLTASDKALSESALDPPTRWNGSTGYSLPSSREQSDPNQ